MNNYTIYCTPDQTKKALEFGAPIETYTHVEPEYSMANGCLPYTEEFEMLKKTTAEQMIGWLEEQKIFVHITPCVDISCSWHITSKGYNQYGYSSDIKVCKTRKKATLEAIDAALEYLVDNKLLK